MRPAFPAAVCAAILSALAAAASAQEAFAPRDPSTLISVLADMQARAEMHSRDEAAVRLNVITPAGIFGAEFLGCTESRDCRALRFSASIGPRPVSAEALNAFNEREVLCRAVLSDGAVDIRYGLLLSDNLTEADLKAHVAVWQGCLTSVASLVSGGS